MAEKEGEYKGKQEKTEKYGADEKVEAIKANITLGIEEGYFTAEVCIDIAEAMVEPLVAKFEKEHLEKIFAISIDADQISDDELRQSVETDLKKAKLEIHERRNTLNTYFASMKALPGALNKLDKGVTLYSQIGKTKIKKNKGDSNE